MKLGLIIAALVGAITSSTINTPLPPPPQLQNNSPFNSSPNQNPSQNQDFKPKPKDNSQNDKNQPNLFSFNQQYPNKPFQGKLALTTSQTQRSNFGETNRPRNGPFESESSSFNGARNQNFSNQNFLRQNDNNQNFDRSSGYPQNTGNFGSRNSNQGERPDFFSNGPSTSQSGFRNQFSDTNNDWKSRLQTFGQSRNYQSFSSSRNFDALRPFSSSNSNDFSERNSFQFSNGNRPQPQQQSEQRSSSYPRNQ